MSGSQPLTSRPVPTLLATTLSISLGALPVFLTGAMAVFIRPELGFSESALGALATIYYLTSALTVFPAGRLAERIGGPKAMALAAGLGMCASLGIAAFARSWATLAGLLALAGVANGIAFPASNLALTRGIPAARQGVAFAVKQSAGPYATLMAGAAVPLVALTVGWRWAFVAGGVAALPIVAGWRIRQQGAPKRHEGRLPGRSLWTLAAAAFFGVSATASLGAFYVESAVAGGVVAGVAGTLLALGSGLGIVGRVWWGWLADRRRRIHFPLLGSIMVVGAVLFLGLGRAWPAPGLAVVTVLLFSTGWAWPSLLNFAVLTRVWQAPGAASGVLGAGQYGGGIVGPLTFGLLVERGGYRVAWGFSASMLVVAAGLVIIGGRGLDRAVAADLVGAL